MSCKPKLEGPCGERCALDPEQRFNDYCFKICRKYLPCKPCEGYYEQCLVTTLAPTTPAPVAPTTASHSTDNSTAFIVVVSLVVIFVLLFILYRYRKKFPCYQAILNWINSDHRDPASADPLLPVKTIVSIHVTVTVNVTDKQDEAAIKCRLSDEGEVTHCHLVLYQVVEDAEDVEVNNLRPRVNNQNGSVRFTCSHLEPECLHRVTVTPEIENDVNVAMNGDRVARYNAPPLGVMEEREFYTIPEPPTEVSCAETSTSITVSCRLPVSLVASRKCYVSARPMEGADENLPRVEATCDDTTDPTRATATIEGLEPRRLYVVTVYSLITQIGGDEGELLGRAEPVNIRTLSDATRDDLALTPMDQGGTAERPVIEGNDVTPDVIPETVQNIDGGQ